MAVYRHTTNLPPGARGSVVAIGNFDGVHRGHRAVLAEAKHHAARLNTVPTVLTFEPHPREVFQPNNPPFRLSSLRTKIHLLEEAGMAHVFMLHFDWNFAAITAESFIEDMLAGNLGAAHVVTGEDFHFGHKRKGNADLLIQKGKDLGFGVSALAPIVDEHGTVISSSRIRACLQEGDIREATRLLERPWEIEGRVEHGEKKGRTIGFPTANIALGNYLEPKHGIYAVRAGIDAGKETQWWDAVAYVGRRPVVNGENVLLEVFVFDRAPDLYDKHLRVQLIDFVRGDWPFESLDTLKTQIAKDCDDARAILARERR